MFAEFYLSKVDSYHGWATYFKRGAKGSAIKKPKVT